MFKFWSSQQLFTKTSTILEKYLTNQSWNQDNTVIADTIDNWLVSTKGRDKNAQIWKSLKAINPYLMIFVNTKER